MTASSPKTIPETDVAIIGAGPVGLFGVFACGTLGLKTHVFDALPTLGGQCTALYPEKPIYDIPGFPRITASDLISGLESQAAPFAPFYHLGAGVTEITNEKGNFRITNQKGNQVHVKSVILAAGAGAFGPNRPPIEQIERYENISVFYAVRNPDHFLNQTLVIAGGGDSAIDWANSLAPRAKKIFLVHRRDNFRAAPESLRQLDTHIAAGRVEKMIPYQLAGVIGDPKTGKISHVNIFSTEGTSRDIPAEALLCFYGLSSDLGVLTTLGLEMHNHQIVISPTTGETSLPGFYAAGDIAYYPQKQKLILTGFAEISQAAQAIYARHHPDRPLHHEHSTTKGVPHLR